MVSIYRRSFSDSIAFTPLIVTYSLEILPYNIRAKGFTIFNLTISLALIFNQYVNPIALGTFDLPCPLPTGAHYYSL